ncbi:MAG: hypothetical protein GEU80_14855 [Dehalococcoidia bacterium]|nr:hypothetical protein [Dehalococcoidia bacterium]
MCVYCGRPFCREHGERGADYIEVCSRKVCQAKWRDVEAHRQWVDHHRVANRSSICAHEACEERMRHQCQRCLLLFCDDHLKSQNIVDRTFNDPPRRVTLMLCRHCVARRDLWD